MTTAVILMAVGITEVARGHRALQAELLRKGEWRQNDLHRQSPQDEVPAIDAARSMKPPTNGGPRWPELAQAAAKVEAKEFTVAIATYEALAKKYAPFREAHAGLGHALVGAQRYQEAIAAYTEAIKIDPEYAGAYLGRGWVRWFVRDLEAAAADYRKLIELEPASALFYGELERVLYELNRPAEVAELWKSAREKNPEWTGAAGSRVMALERAEDWGGIRAEVPPLLATEESAKNPHLHYLLGRALNEAREHRAAARSLREAIRFLRSTSDFNQKVYLQYGEELMYAYLWGGDVDRAREWRKEMLEVKK
jgi:tetratricopeptide (TPR) repeat protein